MQPSVAAAASLSALLLSFLLLPVAAVLTYPSSTGQRLPAIPSKTVLQSFGTASATINLLSDVPDATPVVSDSSLYTVGAATRAAAAGALTNYTIPFSFDASVGVVNYSVSIGSDSIRGAFVIAGITITDGADIASGDDGVGVQVGQKGSFDFSFTAVGDDAAPVDLSTARISAREITGVYFEELDMTNTRFEDDKFIVAIAPYRVGTGRFIISIESDAISVGGESFETVLSVRQDTTPEPPCAVIADNATAVSNNVAFSMYNLLAPPLQSAVSSISIAINGVSYQFDQSASRLRNPTSVVVFPRISSSGFATISCDGSEAVVVPGNDERQVFVTVPSEPVELAVDTLPSPLPTSDDLFRIAVAVVVVQSDPDILPRTTGEAIREEVCKIMGGDPCGVESIERGSAILNIVTLVDDDTGVLERLQSRFDDCTVQSNTGFACSGELELGETEITPPRAVAATSVVSAGLATWTIILIACVGAFALVLVVVLGLWAVYRRSSEQSESYSSSGPLGVPDPADLLYEQSIVRDIYGRGDFPDGGPSLAVAQERAKEADLREEFPRPPSSSGVSRGNASDDASSTYSV